MVRSPMPSLRVQRQQQRKVFRAHALDTARAIVASEGQDGLSMRKLAQRLGCAPMSLYSYFHDKHDLLAALAQQGFDALAHRLGSGKGDGPLAALRGLYLSYARLGFERPDDYRVIFMTPETQHARKAKGADDIYRENPAFAVSLDRVQACVEEGLFNGDAHAIATMLWTTVHGAVAAILTFPDFPFGDRDAYIARIVDWAIDALQSMRTAPLA